MGRWRRAIILVAGILGFASPCSAKVVKFEIIRIESPAFEGRAFGAVGTYDRTLVPPSIDSVGFPRITGFAYPVRIAQPTALKSDEMPPSKGRAYPVFVPKTDADGRDIAGVHLPTLEAPAATHMGWNLRKAGFGEGELCDNNGTMIPFAATREEQLKNSDPRPSMAERYPNAGDRAAAIAKATEKLVRDRLILEEDAKLFATVSGQVLH